jgi:hypothetical protein
MVGGLLGHWAFWTQKAVRLHEQLRSPRRLAQRGGLRRVLSLGAQLTEANAAIFDAAHGFRGCIPGIHEILCRQGLLGGTWCLDPKEVLSRGQREAINRVCQVYPHLADDGFVRERLDGWMR